MNPELAGNPPLSIVSEWSLSRRGGAPMLYRVAAAISSDLPQIATPCSREEFTDAPIASLLSKAIAESAQPLLLREAVGARGFSTTGVDGKDKATLAAPLPRASDASVVLWDEGLRPVTGAVIENTGNSRTNVAGTMMQRRWVRRYALRGVGLPTHDVYGQERPDQVAAHGEFYRRLW